jgi:hypothetical protein
MKKLTVNQKTTVITAGILLYGGMCCLWTRLIGWTLWVVLVSLSVFALWQVVNIFLTEREEKKSDRIGG